MRSLVSADKNRYQDGGHDLDLTYITDRLIAMSFPADGFESSYRNDINAVARFLKEKHGQNFMIFNLCSERGYNYALFDHRVQGWCGFPDHHAPPLALVFRLCRAIDEWLHSDPQHVVVVHCLSQDHQILTSDGFLSMDQVESRCGKSDFFVAGYDEHTGQMVFEKPLRFVSNDVADEYMVSVASDSGDVDLLVTSGHEMWVQRPCDKKFGKHRASDLLNVKSRIMTACGVAEEASSWTCVESLMKALNVANVVELEAMLWKCGNDIGTLASNECQAILAHVLRSGIGKKLLRVVVAGLNAREGGVVLYGEQLRDDVVWLLTIAGYCAWFRPLCTSGGGWEMFWSDDHSKMIQTASARKVVNYKGRTWCVTMPSGFIFARRVVREGEGIVNASCPTLIGNCKAGKGRTGTITSSYLLYCGLFSSATHALNYFAYKRSNNMFGVSSPAQRRYVQYCADVIANQDIPVTPRVILQQVILNCMPKLDAGGGEMQSDGELILEIHAKTREKITVHKSTISLPFNPEVERDAIVFTVNCVVQGDVQIDLYTSKIGLLGGKKMQKICFVQFHTTMCGDSYMVFNKTDCDKAAFDKRFPPNFEMALSWEPVLTSSKPFDSMGEDDIVPNVRSAKSRDGSIVFWASEYDQAEVWTKIRDARNYSSPVGEQIEKAGYLWKQGLTVRNWKERWFILRGASLSYFKSPKNAAPNGVIALESIYTVSLMRDKKIDPTQPYAHSLVLRTEMRDFVVCAQNLIELEEWAEAIKLAMAHAHHHDLMQSPEIGKLFVVIIGAQNLMVAPTGRPYCVVSLARQKYNTQMDDKNGPNPQFVHQVMEFNLHSLLSSMQITVWDDVPNFAPRFCGQVQIPLSTTMQFRQPTAMWFPLMKRTTLSLVSGHLHVMMYFTDMKSLPEDIGKYVSFMASYQGPAAAAPAEGGFNLATSASPPQIPRVNSDDFVMVDSEPSTPRSPRMPEN